MVKENKYIPALSFRWLTPLYDPLLKWGMREENCKRRLIERAGVQPGQHVLDLGCGTGTLTVMLKQSAPEAHITGVDGDEEVLAIAKTKAEQARVDIKWDYGLAYNLPYPDRSFDVVVSSLVIHHLTSADKVRAFQEVRRVLRPAGGFYILDFGRPFSLLTKIQGAVMKNLEEAADNFGGRILPMLKEAGFDSASEAEHMYTLFGPVWFYESIKAKKIEGE
ncbi:MAG: class I SAM-dependent methyltransferase [Chloroflexi bacterium]|nr:class I SAM-dependent methyltransferase [Chloroflexota bacterium]